MNDKPDDCQQDAKCPHAKAAADAAAERAVRKTFAILGVDVDDPAAVEEFRCDLRFGRTMRHAARKGVMHAVTVIVVGALLVFWLGFKGVVRMP